MYGDKLATLSNNKMLLFFVTRRCAEKEGSYIAKLEVNNLIHIQFLSIKIT